MTYDMYIAVKAALLLRGVMPGDDAGVEAAARDRGVAAGRWPAAAAEWHERQHADPRLAHRVGQDLHSALKRRR